MVISKRTSQTCTDTSIVVIMKTWQPVTMEFYVYHPDDNKRHLESKFFTKILLKY